MGESDNLKDTKEKTSRILEKLSSASYDTLKGLSKEQRKHVINTFVIPNSDKPDFNPTPEDIMAQAALYTRGLVSSVAQMPPPIPADVISGVKRDPNVRPNVRPPTGPVLPVTKPTTNDDSRDPLEDTQQLHVSDLEEVKGDDDNPTPAPLGAKPPPVPAAATGGDEYLETVATGDLEFIQDTQVVSDEFENMVEPAEPPEGSRYTFFKLFNGAKTIEEAFTNWLEAKGALDDVLLENFDEDLIRRFFRTSFEGKMFDDAKRLVDKTKDKIDFRHQVGSICLKLYFDGEGEMLDEVVSKFSHVFDFSIFKAYSKLIAVLKELEESREENKRRQEAVDENGRLLEDLKSTQAELDQAKRRIADLDTLVLEKDQTAGQLGIQMTALNRRIQDEMERANLAKQHSGISEGQLSKLRGENDGLKKQLKDTEDETKRVLDKKDEELRLTRREAETSRVSAIEAKTEKEHFERRAQTGDQKVLNLGLTQSDLDISKQRITELETILALERTNAEKLRNQLNENDEKARMAEGTSREESADLCRQNKELSENVTRLEEESARSNTTEKELSSVNQELEIVRQREARLEADLKSTRELNTQLIQQLDEVFGSRPTADSSSHDEKQADIIETPMVEVDPAEQGIYDMLKSGDLKGAEKLGKKSGKGVITALPGYNVVVRERFYGLLESENFKEAVRFRKELRTKIDFSEQILQAYRKFMDEGKIALMAEMRIKFGDEVDLMNI